MTTSVDGKTVADAYVRRLELNRNEIAHLVKKDGKYQGITWGEIHAQVLGIFATYKKWGIAKGDRVCILCQTRSEWNIVDLANLGLGVTTVPIYHSSLAEDVAYILEHCGAKLVVIEDEIQAKKLAEAFSILKKKIPVVAIEPTVTNVASESVTPFTIFAKPSSDAKLEKEFVETARSFTPDSLASIVYTSGTTGKPKGAVLTHANFASELRSIIQGFDLNTNDTTLTFLPLAHILARVESLMPVFSGLKLAFAEGINEVSKNIQEVHPTVLVAVPRIFEKINANIQSQIASAPPFRQAIFKWAVGVGREVARLNSDQKSVPVPLALKYKIADQLVFSKVRTKLGGNIRIAVSGGAPLSAELCEFFHAVGVKIVEGYGLTETTAAITVNRPDNYSFGTVGLPLGDMEFRLASDGEIQARGGMVFKEYYLNPQATKEAFTEDGWFCTGDIGEFSPRGFLKITDRKKEIIVTSAGKNIAPQKIENLLKSIRFISQGMVYGDKQKYLVALVTLNEPEAIKWAKEKNIPFDTYENLVKNKLVIEMIENEIHILNSHLANYETVKKIRILPKDFTIETGELTPSLKIKRKVCIQKYQGYIDEMYS
jgi:long-chain acyl-CoA synthetase